MQVTQNTVRTYNPALDFIREDYRGNPLIKGLFTNDGQVYKVPMRNVLKWQLSRNPKKSEKKKEKKGGFRLPLIQNKEIFKSTKNTIAWLGHACFFIRIDGISILTDPCLEHLPFIPRLVSKPCDYQDITNLDYILLSHGHRDHLDLKSLRQILKFNPNVKFLTALEIGTVLRKLKTSNYQEAGWWQRFRLEHGNITINFLPAKHWNRRGMRDFNKTLWGSFWIETANTKLYFAGDTAYWTHFGEIRELLGQPDIVFMPIGAYKPSYVMKFAHVSPTEATQLFNEIGGTTFIPMHYGTYDLGSEKLSEPIQEMREFAANGSLKGDLKELAVGELFHY